jgi:hypothetical protein
MNQFVLQVILLSRNFLQLDSEHWRGTCKKKKRFRNYWLIHCKLRFFLRWPTLPSDAVFVFFEKVLASCKPCWSMMSLHKDTFVSVPSIDEEIDNSWWLATSYDSNYPSPHQKIQTKETSSCTPTHFNSPTVERMVSIRTARDSSDRSDTATSQQAYSLGWGPSGVNLPPPEDCTFNFFCIRVSSIASSLFSIETANNFKGNQARRTQYVKPRVSSTIHSCGSALSSIVTALISQPRNITYDGNPDTYMLVFTLRSYKVVVLLSRTKKSISNLLCGNPMQPSTICVLQRHTVFFLPFQTTVEVFATVSSHTYFTINMFSYVMHRNWFQRGIPTCLNSQCSLLLYRRNYQSFKAFWNQHNGRGPSAATIKSWCHGLLWLTLVLKTIPNDCASKPYGNKPLVEEIISSHTIEGTHCRRPWLTALPRTFSIW